MSENVFFLARESSTLQIKTAAELHEATELPLPHSREGKRRKTEVVAFAVNTLPSLQTLCFAQVVVRCVEAEEVCATLKWRHE